MAVNVSAGDGVAVLTLDRPERRNALDLGMWEALRDRARAIDPATRAVVVTGAGGHFCAGMDLNPDNPIVTRVMPAVVGGDEEAGRRVIELLKDCVAALAELACPTFAAIEGVCLGSGLEIALACDVRVCGRGATLGLPETRVGMVPDVGGASRLTRLIGPGRAADLVVTSRRVDAEEAYRLGLVERLVDAGTALTVAKEAAAAVCACAPEATRLSLGVVRMAADLGLDEALALETRAGVMALTSGEPREGILAFVEKRAPRWT